MKEIFEKLYEEIKHGDEEHQQWLKNKIEEFKNKLMNNPEKNWPKNEDYIIKPKDNYVPYISEVEEFNTTMNKPNNYTPNIPDEKEWMFVYNFVLEELEEYKVACQEGDIVGVLDALADITYVSLGNGAMLHGLKDRFQMAYAQVQASNMSKVCKTEEEAKLTVIKRSEEQKEPCHYEKVGDIWVVYRTRDLKVMKSINYFKPDLGSCFKQGETEQFLQQS